MSADAGAFHIASMVVRSRLAHDELQRRLSAHAWLDVPFPANQGRAVVVIEAPDQGTLFQRIESVRELPGILDAQLVYHHGEELEPAS